MKYWDILRLYNYFISSVFFWIATRTTVFGDLLPARFNPCSWVFILGLELPSNWTHQPVNQVVELVRLTPSSPEYSEVRSHFVAGGGRAVQLYSVERIQNPQLYSMYLAFKKSMAMRGQVNEMRLFHGTDAANINSINTNNFSRSFAGANGKCFVILVSKADISETNLSLRRTSL